MRERLEAAWHQVCHSSKDAVAIGMEASVPAETVDRMRRVLQANPSWHNKSWQLVASVCK